MHVSMLVYALLYYINIIYSKKKRKLCTVKKYIIIRLITVVVLTSFLLISIGALLQINSATDRYRQTALLQLSQIKEILIQNDHYIDDLKKDIEEDYLIRAKATAYLIQNNEEYRQNIAELKKIATLLQVDEIHIFNEEGSIYSGTVPKYIGLTMNSGEQIGFFLPMLKNKTLELIQPIRPNTAESKAMQYLAVWTKDKKNIVQIGMEPIRLSKALEETNLKTLFNRIVPSPGTTIFAVDVTTGKIISATDKTLINTPLIDLGITNYLYAASSNDTIKTTIHEKTGQTIFLTHKNILIGLTETNTSIYNYAIENIILVILSGVVTGALIIILIYILLDRMILRKLEELQVGMTQITNGDLEYKLSVSGLPEFEKLNNNINLMVQSVLESSRKFSTIFQYVNIPLAMYECRAGVVTITSKMTDILENPNTINNQKVVNPTEFLEQIQQIINTPHPKERDVFIFLCPDKTKYLKIKMYTEETSTWGILLDVTDEIHEKQNIKFERDMDFLTNIYNRRAFLEELNHLAKKPEKVKKAAIVMMDLDNLKFVNDSWGHAYGDNFICRAAQVLKDFNHPDKLAARLSGDEFVIMLYGADSNEQLEQDILRLKKEFRNAYISNPNDDPYPISISGGYAFYPEQSAVFRDVLHLADLAMYVVKKGHKGEFKKYQEESNTENNA